VSDELQPGGGRGELVFAVVVCALAMFLPVYLVQHGYDSFTAEHGAVLEGAAGATLALAVVLRTVSRTVLRTMIRTGARAGLRAGVKGALQGALRVATRNLFASIFKSAFGRPGAEKSRDPAVVARSNRKSLLAASGLLYASWVIVIGFGQPFEDLMTTEQAASAEEAAAERRAELANARPQPAQEAYLKKVELDEARDQLGVLRSKLKGSRDVEGQQRLRHAIADLHVEVTDLQYDFNDLRAAAGGRLQAPLDERPLGPEGPVAALIEFLFTRAPFPGLLPWASPVIWLGALLFVIPLWVIYFAQSTVARKQGVLLRHETGPDGGAIQLYFAGAFSYMPLSSDVVVEGNAEQKGRVSLIGLLVPLAISVGLWAVWRATGGTLGWLLLASDAFLIYPMVQCFPLAPLDGVQLWRWKRGLWAAVFVATMGAFLFMGSEGLKNVI